MLVNGLFSLDQVSDLVFKARILKCQGKNEWEPQKVLSQILGWLDTAEPEVEMGN